MNVFNLQYESFGEIISVPLIPDGENTLVAADNRQDFVDRLVQVRPISSPFQLLPFQLLDVDSYPTAS
jgi:hypothetical protein